MDQQETHRLFNECQAKRQAALASGASDAAADAAARDHWNAWAEGILKEKPEGRSDRDWAAKAAAIFASREIPVCFRADTSFAGWIFPGRADFSNAEFQGDAWFHSATFQEIAGFESATFEGHVWFESATFEGDAWFHSATFQGNAWFESPTFKGYTNVGSATFQGDAWFGNATFEGDVWFGNSTFHGYAGFRSATFEGDVWFDSAAFERHARFDSATWDGFVSFARSEFYGDATFQAAKATRAFSLAGATFHAVPDFVQANFSEAPRLDNLHIYRSLVQPRRLWLTPWSVYSAAGPVRMQVRSILPRLRASRVMVRVMAEPLLFWRATKRAISRIGQRLSGTMVDEPVKWRALRRLAIQGHDYQREQSYFAQETRALRYTEDWPAPFKFWRGQGWRGTARFWLGYIYGFLSDFGRSVTRPLLLWAILIAIFTCVYLNSMRDMPKISAARYTANDTISKTWQPVDLTVFAYATGLPCVKGDGRNIAGLKPEVTVGTNAFWEALRISFANAVVLGDLGGTEGTRLAYGCLYGLERIVPHGAVADEAKRSWLTTTYLPPAMLTATRIQKGMSALLIFLFGLALRNMLKLK